VLRREEYQGLELNAKLEAIRGLIPLGLMHVQELLDDEVLALAAPRHVRRDNDAPGMRYGSNPESVRLGGQRLPMRVPRVRSERGEIPLRSYQAVHESGEVNDALLRRVPYGISCRNYVAAAEAIPGALGLSSSSVSRAFVEASAAKLREFQERDLSRERFAALFLDGKTFADATLVIALGVTRTGEKRLLGFVETDNRGREGAGAVPAFAGRAPVGDRARRAGGDRRRQRAQGGGEPGVQAPGGGAALHVAQARERGQPSAQGRTGDLAAAPAAGL
jgi:transposase-like protein